jgi:hypothetical protein
MPSLNLVRMRDGEPVDMCCKKGHCRGSYRRRAVGIKSYSLVLFHYFATTFVVRARPPAVTDLLGGHADIRIQQRLVRSREALHCSPFLHRCHPIGPRHRFGLCQTQEAHISPDGFARDGRRWAPASRRRTGKSWARRSEKKQHHQCDFHRVSPSVLLFQCCILLTARA